MIELIPAIDIIDGKCVRLSQGDYNTQKVYNENPVEVAKEFEAHGIHRLHIVDLDGAVSRHVVNYRVLDQIASRTSLVIDFGGGIKTDEDLVIAFDNGAQMVTLGSVAVKNPGLFKKWLEQYGNEKIILGADVKENKISLTIAQRLPTCNANILNFKLFGNQACMSKQGNSPDYECGRQLWECRRHVTTGFHL